MTNNKAVNAFLLVFWFVGQTAIVCFFLLLAMKIDYWWIVLFSIPCLLVNSAFKVQSLTQYHEK